MSEDYRQTLIDTFRESLIAELNPEQIEFATRKLMLALNDYELTKRTTDVIVYDDANERIIKHFLACLVIDGKSSGTAAQYKRTIVRMLDVVQKNLTDFTTNDVRYYLAVEKENGVSNRTLENYRANLSAFFTWMTAEEIIKTNPCARIKPIKYADEVRKPFSDTDIDALRFACSTVKQRAILELLLASGVRVNEMSTMLVSDIDFRALTVLVRNGKGNKQRTTYINDVASHYLQKYLAERTDDGPYLFYNKNHEPIASGGVRFILREVGERAGVEDVHPHRFRRTFATRLAKRGMIVQEIQKLLGHSNINTTLVYVYADDEHIKASYKQYSA